MVKKKGQGHDRTGQGKYKGRKEPRKFKWLKSK